MSQSNNKTHSEHQKHSSTKEKQGDQPSHNKDKDKDKDDHAKQQAQRDKTLKDSFPASDPPPTE